MTNNKSIVANFFQPTLSGSVGSGGSVIKNPDQFVYPYNSTVPLTAVPLVGYAFTGWSGNASGTQNPLLLTMDATKFITALPDLIVDDGFRVVHRNWLLRIRFSICHHGFFIERHRDVPTESATNRQL